MIDTSVNLVSPSGSSTGLISLGSDCRKFLSETIYLILSYTCGWDLRLSVFMFGGSLMAMDDLTDLALMDEKLARLASV